MDLLIDVGNTNIKWTCHAQDRLEPSRRCPHRGELPAELSRTWQKLPRPRAVRVANVAGPDMEASLRLWTGGSWGCEPHFVMSEARAFGVTNGYFQPDQLGVDRWLALLAVHTRIGRSALIIDCGTAVTLDAIAASGKHLGGLIVPGLKLMRQSLLTGTRIPPHEPEQDSPWLAHSTGAGITAGPLQALLALIARLQQLLKSRTNAEPELVVTGGDAEEIIPHLESDCSHEPDLVLQGLALLR
jgi:type III pantothenate kinase